MGLSFNRSQAGPLIWRQVVKTIKTIVENTQNWKRVPIGTLFRVRDEDAVRMVNNKEASYAPKSEWKELRDNETNNNKEKDNAKD